MSYENLPKNRLEKAALTRAGKAEYYQLSSDPFPSPAADLAGEILEHTDTGMRYRWTGSVWVYDTSSMVICEPYYGAVSRGKVLGERIVTIDGSNPEVDFSAGPADLWDLEGQFVYPTANEQWEVISTDINDTAGGTGAQSLILTYLDENYVEQQVTFPTNGTAAANIPVSNCFRPISLNVTSVGSTGSNQGIISLRVSGGGANRIGILENNNGSLHGLYTVPAGYEAYFLYGYSSIAKSKEAAVRVSLTNGDNGIFTRELPIELFESAAYYQSPAPRGPLPEKTDIRLSAVAFNNNCRVSGSMQLHLVPTT